MSDEFDVLEYWERRYHSGKHHGSGEGSRGRAAKRKANRVNRLINDHRVKSVIDFGCGDGIVIKKLRVARYLGLEVSQTALDQCASRVRRRKGWTYRLYDGFDPGELPQADLVLSLDVIFHQIDDELYRRHMELLFSSAPLVCIHSTNVNRVGNPHVKHRAFVHDVPEGWQVIERPRKPSWNRPAFWIFKKG